MNCFKAKGIKKIRMDHFNSMQREQLQKFNTVLELFSLHWIENDPFLIFALLMCRCWHVGGGMM